MKKDFIHLDKLSIRISSIESVKKESEYSPTEHYYIIRIYTLNEPNLPYKLAYKDEKERDKEFNKVQKELNQR